MAHGLIDSPAVDRCSAGEQRWPRCKGGGRRDSECMADKRTPEDDRGRQPPGDPRDVPETPPDEPKPVPVQDPPAEPDTPPYVVR
jgi:hypothetical protein